MEKQTIDKLLIDIKCIYKYNENIKTYYLKKWLIDYDEKVNYTEIAQSSSSLPLLWENIFYPNTTTHFFLELVNTFQKLETKDKKRTPYNSYSQAITTYCLKTLARIIL